MLKARARIALLLLCALLLPLSPASAAAAVAADKGVEPGEAAGLPQGFDAELDRITEAPVEARAPNWWVKLGELALALAIIVAMIVVVAHLMRRTIGRGGGGGTRSLGPMRLLGSFHFDPRHSVQLLEVGKRVLVVGLAENAVVLLDKIEDKETIAELRRAAPAAETLRHFGEHLRSAFSRVKKSENLERSRGAVQKLKEGLKGKADKDKH